MINIYYETLAKYVVDKWKFFYSTGVVSPSGDVTDIDGNAKTKYLKKRKRIIR